MGVTFDETTKVSTSPIKSNSVSYEEMQLINKPIFLINTDNVMITTIEGTEDGRIFLGGGDGCLYEVYYQAESNWFGKRCKKINHSQGLMSYMVPGFLKAFSETDPIVKIVIDNSRKILYTLTEKGSIEAWDLGIDYTTIRRIAKLTQNDICQLASNILKSVDDTVFKPVTAICVLTRDDCPNMHLIAITQSGVRFYFTTTHLQIGPNQLPMELQKPQGLYLLHVRMPPGYTTNATVGKPKNVHSAFYSQGSVLMISNSQQDKDALWSLSSEPFPLRPYLAESTTILPLDGQVWALAEVNKKKIGKLKNTFTENYQTPKKVVLLTNQGAHILALLKPVDILQQILLSCHGPHHDAVKAYFQVQSEPQACATSVIISCIDQLQGSELAFWATQAFLLYGGRPRVDINVNNTMMQDNRFATMIQDGNRTQIDHGSPRMIMSTPYATRPTFVGGGISSPAFQGSPSKLSFCN